MENEQLEYLYKRKENLSSQLKHLFQGGLFIIDVDNVANDFDELSTDIIQLKYNLSKNEAKEYRKVLKDSLFDEWENIV
ncbi:MAG: hypothetical protein HUJ68_03485 [Clostridia bacterium]|nr:hypothetical protein [Clostridia bacterium]